MAITKFEIEKRMYSKLLQKLLTGKRNESDIVTSLIKMETIEEIIKLHGDEIITIVSTKDTYDGAKTVPATEMVTPTKEDEIMLDDAGEPVIGEASGVPAEPFGDKIRQADALLEKDVPADEMGWSNPDLLKENDDTGVTPSTQDIVKKSVEEFEGTKNAPVSVSPTCESCTHKQISHNKKKGCRFCDCNWKP